MLPLGSVSRLDGRIACTSGKDELVTNLAKTNTINWSFKSSYIAMEADYGNKVCVQHQREVECIVQPGVTVSTAIYSMMVVFQLLI